MQKQSSNPSKIQETALYLFFALALLVLVAIITIGIFVPERDDLLALLIKMFFVQVSLLAAITTNIVAKAKEIMATVNKE